MILLSGDRTSADQVVSEPLQPDIKKTKIRGTIGLKAQKGRSVAVLLISSMFLSMSEWLSLASRTVLLRVISVGDIRNVGSWEQPVSGIHRTHHRAILRAREARISICPGQRFRQTKSCGAGGPPLLFSVRTTSTEGAPPLRSWQGWEARPSASNREEYKSEGKGQRQGNLRQRVFMCLREEASAVSRPTLRKKREGWGTPGPMAPATSNRGEGWATRRLLSIALPALAGRDRVGHLLHQGGPNQTREGGPNQGSEIITHPQAQTRRRKLLYDSRA